MGRSNERRRRVVAECGLGCQGRWAGILDPHRLLPDAASGVGRLAAGVWRLAAAIWRVVASRTGADRGLSASAAAESQAAVDDQEKGLHGRHRRACGAPWASASCSCGHACDAAANRGASQCRRGPGRAHRGHGPGACQSARVPECQRGSRWATATLTRALASKTRRDAAGPAGVEGWGVVWTVYLHTYTDMLLWPWSRTLQTH